MRRHSGTFKPVLSPVASVKVETRRSHARSLPPEATVFSQLKQMLEDEKSADTMEDISVLKLNDSISSEEETHAKETNVADNEEPLKDTVSEHTIQMI
jgi:hypothetical protein